MSMIPTSQSRKAYYCSTRKNIYIRIYIYVYFSSSEPAITNWAMWMYLEVCILFDSRYRWAWVCEKRPSSSSKRVNLSQLACKYYIYVYRRVCVSVYRGVEVSLVLFQIAAVSMQKSHGNYVNSWIVYTLWTNYVILRILMELILKANEFCFRYLNVSLVKLI